MSLIIYDKYLKTLPKKYNWLKVFKPPVYEIELSNNKLSATCHYNNGSHKYYNLSADFSNRRMLFIDFDTAIQAVVDLLHKFPKHAYAISGFAVINVSEELLDGLTPIETRMILELMHVASSKAKRNMICTEIRYRGEIIMTISILDRAVG